MRASSSRGKSSRGIGSGDDHGRREGKCLTHCGFIGLLMCTLRTVRYEGRTLNMIRLANAEHSHDSPLLCQGLTYHVTSNFNVDRKTDAFKYL